MTEFLPFLPGFLAAYAILFVAASSPGPAVAMLLGIATTQGRAPALTASAGIASGSVVINLLTLIGVGLLLQQAAWAMTVLRLLGAAYLAYLALGAFRKALHPPRIAPANVAEASPWRYFAAGFILQVTNPKAIAFWLAIAAVGATHGGGTGILALFVIGAWGISMFCHGGWAIVLSSAPVRSAYNAGRRWIDGALGGFFLFAAFKMATQRG